jgi:acetyltransferase
MQTLNELSHPKLKYLTDVDYVRRLELVATVAGEDGEREVGAAMYAAEADGESCEFAIAVDDAWQGTGVAGILMIDLMDAARQRGLREMIGLVLAENHRMVKFVRQLGFTLRRDPTDPHIFVATKPLALRQWTK